MSDGTTTIAPNDGSDNRRTVDKWTVRIPGLEIVPMCWLESDDSFTVEDGWYRLSHIASGRSVGPYVYPSIAAARRTADRLADLFDWTEPIEDLNDYEGLGDVKAACLVEAKHVLDLWWSRNP